MKYLDQLFVFKQVNGQLDWLLLEETEQVLMKAAQDEDNNNVI